MRGEDMRFEIVGHDLLPLRNGTPQTLGKRHGGHPRTYARIGFARRDPLVRLHDHEGQPRKIERERRHDLAPSGAELRGVAHEERRIAAQLGGAGDQLRFGQMQVEKPVESQQNRRAVGRTAAQPGAERHPLVEPDGDAVHAVTVVHQPESLDTDILFGFAVHRQPFGTAWVYEHDGAVVANCHRRPAAEFTRRRLGVDEIVTAFADLMAGPLGGREVILTVSPVRHLGDSLAGNAVSKAALRLAAEELAERFPDVHYFPAYEILNDDLRDYRFYADDLVHPAPQAVEYVWEKFSAAVLSEQARRLLPDVRHIVVAAAHRPRNPQSATYREFCRRRLEEIAALPQIDFRTEAEYFRRCIEINS